MDYAVDQFSGELSFVTAREVFSKAVFHTAPGYTRRIYSSVEAGKILGREYTCLTKKAREGKIGGEFKNGYWRFSLADLSGYLLDGYWREARRPWTDVEIDLLRSGHPVPGRSTNACAVKRSKIKRHICNL